MRMNKNAMVELMAYTGENRAPIASPYLDTSSGAMLVATNGCAMVAVPVELEDGDSAGYVSKDVLKAARKASRACRFRDTVVALNGAATIPGGMTMPREGESSGETFPNWRASLPKAKEAPGGMIELTINPERLLNLARAMAIDPDKGIKLHIRANDAGWVADPISVSGSPIEGAIGVIMPMRSK